VTAGVLDDGNACYTPGISEVRSGTTTYSHSGLKHLAAQSCSGASVSATRGYDAFGGVASSSGSWQGPFGSAGAFGYQTESSGLHLLGHRYYDASLGRFLTRDPIGDGSNWYVYGGNDPVGNADPSGLVLIRLRFRPVFTGGGIVYHAYIEVVDNVRGSRTYGKSHNFGGGPDLPWPRQTNLESKSGPAVPGQYDYGHSGELNPIELVNDSSPYQPWVDEFERIELELWPVPYNPIRDNSNSYVRELLERFGLLPDLDLLLKHRHARLPHLPGWNGDPWGDKISRRRLGPVRPGKRA
jgi:RHS repeat-associated protein